MHALLARVSLRWPMIVRSVYCSLMLLPASVMHRLQTMTKQDVLWAAASVLWAAVLGTVIFDVMKEGK